MFETVAEELDELAHNALRTQHLHNRKDEIRRRDAVDELSGELEADDLGYEHGDRLAEHRRLRLYAADAPAEYPESVDHGRM